MVVERRDEWQTKTAFAFVMIYFEEIERTDLKRRNKALQDNWSMQTKEEDPADLLFLLDKQGGDYLLNIN